MHYTFSTGRLAFGFVKLMAKFAGALFAFIFGMTLSQSLKR